MHFSIYYLCETDGGDELRLCNLARECLFTFLLYIFYFFPFQVRGTAVRLGKSCSNYANQLFADVGMTAMRLHCDC